ncbi:MAG: extracellular solute-binding protein [Treponema sp.]|jgi:multiple sugar transport system substrate-binding protein|nr:extracellular solute-binding protein [Treponema sp.]
MIKNVIKKLIVLLFICLVATSCSKREADGPSGSEKVTITFGGWPSADEGVKAALAGFKEEHPNIDIEFHFSNSNSGDYMQLVQTALSAGTGAEDVVSIEGGSIAQFRDSPALEDFLSSPYNAEKYSNDFVAYKWDQSYSSDHKRLVAIPWDMGPVTLFYRADVFREVGLPSEPDEVAKLISTWDGVLDVAKKVYIPGKRWLLPSAANLYFEIFMNRDYYDRDLSLVIERPGDIECLNTVIAMRKNKWDMNVNFLGAEAMSGFANGSLAGFLCGSWLGGMLKTALDPDGAGHWKVTRLLGPVPPTNWGGSFLAIPKQSKHKAEAWAFISYMLASERGQNDIFKAIDYFPAYKPAWKDNAIYDVPDPYFGDQHTRVMWRDLAAQLRPVYTTIMDQNAENQLENSVNAGIEKGLDAAGIRALFKQNVETANAELMRQQIETLKDAGVWKN